MVPNTHEMSTKDKNIIMRKKNAMWPSQKKEKKKERGLISDLTCTVYSTSLNQDCPMGIVTAFPHFNYKENTDEEIQ